MNEYGWVWEIGRLGTTAKQEITGENVCERMGKNVHFIPF